MMADFFQVCLKHWHTRNRHLRIISKCMSSLHIPTYPQQRTQPPSLSQKKCIDTTHEIFLLGWFSKEWGEVTLYFLLISWKTAVFLRMPISGSRVVIPTKSPKKTVVMSDKFHHKSQLPTLWNGEILGIFCLKIASQLQNDMVLGGENFHHWPFSGLGGLILRNWHICPFWS